MLPSICLPTTFSLVACYPRASKSHPLCWHPARAILARSHGRGFLDPIEASRTISDACLLGHSIGIDDFGTGYSSLQYLESIPLDALKINKSIIDTVGTVAATSLITPHIIEIAKSLGLIIVAEGVERQEQADYLKHHGVHFVQGWLYSKPLPAREFVKYYQ